MPMLRHIVPHPKKYQLLTVAMMVFDIPSIARALGIGRERVSSWWHRGVAMPAEYEKPLCRKLFWVAKRMSISGDIKDGPIGSLILKNLKPLAPHLFEPRFRYNHVREAVVEYMESKGDKCEASDAIEFFEEQGVGRQTLYNAIQDFDRIRKSGDGVWTLKHAH